MYIKFCFNHYFFEELFTKAFSQQHRFGGNEVNAYTKVYLRACISSIFNSFKLDQIHRYINGSILVLSRQLVGDGTQEEIQTAND